MEGSHRANLAKREFGIYFVCTTEKHALNMPGKLSPYPIEKWILIFILVSTVPFPEGTQKMEMDGPVECRSRGGRG